MQIMGEKGLLKRDESQMKHIYSVAEEEQKTKAYLLDKFVNTMYKGSASKLVLQLLGNKKASKAELKEIKDILKKLEE
jgi:predicted transcriptional regulator